MYLPLRVGGYKEARSPPDAATSGGLRWWMSINAEGTAVPRTLGGMLFGEVLIEERYSLYALEELSQWVVFVGGMDVVRGEAEAHQYALEP